MLEVRKLSFKYKKRQVLFEDLSFNARVGEFLVIIGSNGAGKSSLLKLLSGTLQPSQGAIVWNGRNIKDYQPLDLAKQRGVLTQFTSIGFEFLVKDIVLMGRYPHYRSQMRQKDHDVAVKAMKLTGVYQYENTSYQNLSGGEQQRVQLARVLAQIWKENDKDEGLLLLDEPVSSLDLKHQHNVLQIAQQLTKIGYSCVAVLHDLNLTLQYADRVMLMDRRTVKLGTPQEIVTPENIDKAYGISSRIITDPMTGKLQLVTGIESNVELTLESL